MPLSSTESVTTESVAQILTSTTIDFKREKNTWEQPIFFPGYIQKLAGNSNWNSVLAQWQLDN